MMKEHGDDEQERLARLVAGEATAEEAAALIGRAATEPVLCQRLTELAAIEAMLGIAAEDELGRERRVRQTMEFLRQHEQEDFVADFRSRMLRRRRWCRGIAAAAAALVALLAGGWYFMAGRPIATVARAETVTWQDGRGWREGTGMKPGARIRFDSGLLEMRIAEESTLIVEGPADLQLVSAGRSLLRRGRVVVHGGGKRGYRVETARGTVNEGSDYAVAVSDAGAVELAGLGGDLSFAGADGATVAVKRGQTLDPGAAGPLPQDASFYTALPPAPAGPAGYVHWALDEGRGDISAAVSEGMPPGPMALSLATAAGLKPRWVEGRFGAGLELDGRGAFGESPFRGIAGGQPRTVCCWVKVPVDFSPLEGFAIVSWGRFSAEKAGAVWQISVNPNEKEGPVGRLRVGTHLGHLVGSSDLRDGRWHHLAVVLYGGSAPDIGTHVLVYLDGRLESISRRSLREVRTDLNADHGVWIGRDITDRPVAGNPLEGHFFRGGIDEVYIFNAALPPAAIRQLMRNEVPR